METVTLGRSSFSYCVTISQTEHEYLLQQVREYNTLRNALFRGGLTTETLETLLAGECEAGSAQHGRSSETKLAQQHTVPANSNQLGDETNLRGGATAGNRLHTGHQPYTSNQYQGYGHPESDTDHDVHTAQRERAHTQDQHTLLVANLSDRTTYKDLTAVVRGGKLLEIHIRNDRLATISFVEGASEFLAYTKRNDIYLHTKRLEFSWSPRQFNIPTHVLNKISSGASRNLVLRGVAGKVTAEQIRDHLDHIHNLVVVDVSFKNGDALVSTNSIHNALFARTCMMSRTVYKGVKIEWAMDECAAPLLRSRPKLRVPVASVSKKPTPTRNHYAILDTGSELDSESEGESYMNNGISIDHSWANAVVA